MAGMLRRTHIVPTHLHVPEMAFSFGSLTITVRQFLVLLIGSAVSYDLWLRLAVLSGFSGGQVIRLLGGLAPVSVTAAISFLKIAGRSLERWLLVLARFWNRPHRFVWRSVRFLEWSDGVSLHGHREGGEAL